MNQNQIQEVSYTQPQDKKHAPTTETSSVNSNMNSSMYYKGGLIGAAITVFASWNTGRYNRIGHYFRRWKFIRYFVSTKPIQQLSLITNYHRPNLKVIADNFYCYSGQSGIGKSFHFKDLTQKQSYIRPTLYVSFKSTGRQVNFQNDIAEQLKFGQDGAGIIAEIIKAVRKIKQINQNPFKFRFKYFCTHIFFLGIYTLILQSNLHLYANCLLYSGTFLTQAYYIKFMGPLLQQSSRATLPVMIFDDINKIQQMNMLAQIVRFLKIIEDETANIILISSDQETWSNLRRQPGMKDRLRIRNIKYDHIETANRMIELLNQNFQFFKFNMTPNAILDALILKGMINQLIGQRQMSIRRFLSLIKLVDEQQYELYIQIFKNTSQLPVSEIIKAFRQLFFDFQAETMVINLKTIKRQLPNMALTEFFANLDLLSKKKMLTSDNKIAPNLKLYNIVRDLRSQYVITGRYTDIVYEMALKKYKLDIKEYQLKGQNVKQ